MLRALIVDRDGEARAALRRLLATSGRVSVVGEFDAPRPAMLEGPARRPNLLIVEAAGTADEVAAAVEQFAHAFPDAAVLATASAPGPDLVLRAIRAGAIEVLARPPQRDDLAQVLDKLVRLRGGATDAAVAGRVTAVFAGKGGLGVTTLAANLAVCLARRGPGEALLVEMDTRASDAATLLSLRPTYSVLDAFENIDRLDELFLRSLLVRHPGGLWVLPAPPRPERFALTADQVRAGLGMMRAHFQHLVLDLRHDVEPATVAALETADVILLLTDLTVPALRSNAAALAALRALGVDLGGRLRVVVARGDDGFDVTPKDASDALAAPIAWTAPSDYRATVEAANRGEPVVTAAPRSRIARSVRALAETVAGSGRPPAAAPAGGLLRFVRASRPFAKSG
jgi:pilus assembly protein CpaE